MSVAAAMPARPIPSAPARAAGERGPHDGTSASAGVRTIDDRGRLVESGVSEGDRRLAILMHLSPLLALAFPPLLAIPPIVWLLAKDRSPFLDDHFRALADAVISYILWFTLATITVVGIVLWPVLVLVGFIAMVRAAADAGSSRYVRYPLTLSILS